MQDKAFVEYFDNEITHLLEETTYGLDFVVSHYLEEREKRVKLIKDYLNGDDVDPNNLQLIINAKNMPELPISPKMKKCADQRNIQFWENNKPAVTHKYGFCVSFGSYENVKNVLGGRRQLDFRVRY